ncbi:MAG: preprotein translocase subunit SecY [Chloroflexota bacterium]|nr:preprotein translocase subunit SecY [Chloroflexota bacterium]
MVSQSRKESRPGLIQAMIDAFGQADLRLKILLTLGLLVAFRFVAHVPIPGADAQAMSDLLQQGQGLGPLLGMVDLFSGGAMREMSVAAMGVYPYITALIIMQLLVPVIPRLQALSREGEAGRAKINQYTHWLTVPLAMLQAYGQLVVLQGYGIVANVGFSGANLLPTVSMVLTMTAGTMFLVWLGELITEYGIGNGVSLIIFAGIVATLPDMIGRGYLARGNIVGLVVFLVFALAIIVVIVIFTEAHRRIPVQYARSLFRGGRMYRQSGSTHIPLRVNSSGMIPLIFAMALIMFPGVVASFFANPVGESPNFANTIQNLFNTTGWFYWVLFFFLAVGFTFFYSTIIFQQQNLAGTLQRQGAFVPGIRPGKATDQYLNRVLTRITWAGALFLGVVAISPFVVQSVTNIQVLTLPAIGMLIVVGVALDTMRQLEAQLLMRRYEGFLK